MSVRRPLLLTLRASTLLHVSCLIGRPMQCHTRFLMMWMRESEERERGRCFAKQPPHERNNHLMRQLHNHCMSCCCHATHNIPFLYAQIKGFYYSTRRLKDNSLYKFSIETTQYYGTIYQTTPMYLPLWRTRLCLKSRWLMAGTEST
jgi:hypothetical protein